MSPLAIVLTASLAQNVILVHYLGVWPLPVVLQSPRRAVYLSASITAALMWVSGVYWLIRRVVIVPLGVEVLETLVLTAILALSTLGAMRLGSQIAPFYRKRIMQTVPVILINTTVFVVSMGLARSVETYPEVLLGAVAAGAGLFFALVPLAAVRVHFERTQPPSSLLRGDVSVYLATAVMALAIQQIDVLLQRFLVPLY
jgi:electron transport complex protein RnfA